MKRLTCSPREAMRRLEFEVTQPPVAKNGNGVGARATLYNMGCRSLRPLPETPADLWGDDEMVYGYTTAGKIVALGTRMEYDRAVERGGGVRASAHRKTVRRKK
jgi:hypothetical protein